MSDTRWRCHHRLCVSSTLITVIVVSRKMINNTRMNQVRLNRYALSLVCKHSLMDGMKAIGSPGTTVGVIMSRERHHACAAILENRAMTSSLLRRVTVKKKMSGSSRRLHTVYAYGKAR